MSIKIKKTNVVRILEKAGIEFNVYEYEVDEDNLDAITVANKINAEKEKVFKTLVAQSNTELFVFCIPGNYELDLKKAAICTNSKKIELIRAGDLQRITGYLRGGCSPIGMKKPFRTIIDESAIIFPKIIISGGIRGLQVELQPQDLSDLISAEFADII